jgi:hypothetical protein
MMAVGSVPRVAQRGRLGVSGGGYRRFAFTNRLARLRHAFLLQPVAPRSLPWPPCDWFYIADLK